MFTLFALVLCVATAALFFLPELWKAPCHNLLLIGGILWFAVSRWMKRKWKRRVQAIANRFGDPRERIRDIGESPDFWLDYPRSLQRMDFFAQGDLGTAGIVFTSCSIIWLGFWVLATFSG